MVPSAIWGAGELDLLAHIVNMGKAAFAGDHP
jgi:hypothetical protein